MSVLSQTRIFGPSPPLSDRLVLSQTRIFGPNPAPSHRIDLAKNRKNSELGKIKQMRIFGPPPPLPLSIKSILQKIRKIQNQLRMVWNGEKILLWHVY